MKDLSASSFEFSMQFDKSTDDSQYRQLLVFVRYALGENMKKFLSCEAWLDATKKGDIFGKLKEFFVKHKFHWPGWQMLCRSPGRKQVLFLYLACQLLMILPGTVTTLPSC